MSLSGGWNPRGKKGPAGLIESTEDSTIRLFYSFAGPKNDCKVSGFEHDGKLSEGLLDARDKLKVYPAFRATCSRHRPHEARRREFYTLKSDGTVLIDWVNQFMKVKPRRSVREGSVPG